MNVQIEIDIVREANGQREHSSLSVTGELMTIEQGHRIVYRNTEESMRDVITTLTVTPSYITIENGAPLSTRLVLEPGQPHRSLYNTGYGTLTIMTYGKSVDNRLEDPLKTLSFTYDLTINGVETSHHTLFMTLHPITT